MHFRPHSLLFAAAVAFAGCKESASTETDTGATPAADSGMTLDDASTPNDSGAPSDSGTTTGTDARPTDSGTSSTPDSGPSMQGPTCHDLEECCGTLNQFLQMSCFQTAAAWDEGACQSSLDRARNLGSCQPVGFDSGMTGPLGPVCQGLLDECCPTLGSLAGACEGVANGADETRCQTTLDLAQRFGNCVPEVDGGVLPDAGTSTTTLDAGLHPDAEIMDTGTSSVADAG